MADHHVDLVSDRIKEQTETTGDSDLVLTGAMSGFRSFADIGDGKSTYYALEDGDSTAFEVGVGTYTASGTVLSRDNVIASTAVGNAKITLSGTSTVFCTYPAGESVHGIGSGASMTQTSSQAISTGALYQITFDTTSAPGFAAVGGAVVADTSNNKLTLKEKGLYFVSAHLGAQNGDAVYPSGFWLTIGTGTTLGTQFAMTYTENNISSNSFGVVTTPYYVASPDDDLYMNVWFESSSGATEYNTLVNEERYKAKFSAVFIR